MLAPYPSDRAVVGGIGAVFPTPAAPGYTTVRVGRNLPIAAQDVDNYEGGKITFANCPNGSDTFTVVSSIPENEAVASEVTILGVPGACAGLDTPFTLIDDDDLAVLGTHASAKFPDGGTLLLDAYKSAYIIPVDAGAQYQSVVEFDDYLSYGDILFGIGGWNDMHALTSTADFWSCLVVGAWEGSDSASELTYDGDGDPDECPQNSHSDIPLTGVRRPNTTECLVLLQAIADDSRCLTQTDEAHNVVHEIAHTCGQHPQHISNSIMDEGAPKNQDSFSAESLKIFREQDTW